LKRSIPTAPHPRAIAWRRSTLPALVALGLLGSAGAAVAQTAAEPHTASGSYLAARQAERSRDLAAAAEYMRQALGSEPGNLELMTRSFFLLLADGRFDDALVAARQIVAQQPQALVPGLAIAVADARAGDFAAAERRVEPAPGNNLNRVVAALMRAWSLAGQGRTEDAVKALEPIGAIEGLQTVHALHAGYILDLGGRTAEAEAEYKRAATVRQGNLPPRVVEAVGTFYERAGKPEEARAFYAAYREQAPDSPLVEFAQARMAAGTMPAPVVASAAAGLAETFYTVAGLMRQESEAPMAMVYARLAEALTPDSAALNLMLGDILDGQRRPEDSNRFLGRVAPDSPFYLAARLRMAENLDELKRTDEGLAELERLATAYPTRIDSLLTLGNLLRIRERFAEAAAAYDRAVERIAKPEERHWSLFYARAIALERSKQWTRAEPDFKKALELRPEQPDVMNYLAYSWVEQGQNYDLAREMLERAVKLRPNSGHIIDSLGWVLYRTGKFEEAVPHLERAAEILHSDPVILDHLGDAYWRVGRKAEARFQWERALINKPDVDLKPVIERKLSTGLAGDPPPPNRSAN